MVVTAGAWVLEADTLVGVSHDGQQIPDKETWWAWSLSRGQGGVGQGAKKL